MSDIFSDSLVVSGLGMRVDDDHYVEPSEEVLKQLRQASRDALSKRRERLQVMESRIADESEDRMQTTVTEKTLEDYARCSRQLYRKWLRENGMKPDTDFGIISALDFVNWLIVRKREWKPATWRKYRQSVYVMLLDYQVAGIGTHLDDALDLIQNDVIIRSMDNADGMKRRATDTADGRSKTKGPSLKMKKFPQQDFVRVISWLRYKSRSSCSRDLEIWLRAGILTGLRPSEWKGTEFVSVRDDAAIHGYRAYLHVICAKATNGRGFDVVRTLDLSTFPEKDIAIIREQSRSGREHYASGDFLDHYRDCADLLSRACKAIWPRRKTRYSLYSCRHQAIANFKHAGFSKVEIAVMAGHASIQTAGESYGRKSYGWSGLTHSARPVREQLEIAKKRERDFHERQYGININSPGRKPGMSPTP